MIALLEFVFRSFWTFAGVVVLLTLVMLPFSAFAQAFGAALGANRRKD